MLNPLDGGDGIPNPPAFVDVAFAQPKSLVVADDMFGDFAKLGIGALLDGTSPQPKSLWVAGGIAGDFIDFTCDAGAAGSGVDQASFEPQASAFDRLEKVFWVGGAED